jgi:hypothetical protein
MPQWRAKASGGLAMFVAASGYAETPSELDPRGLGVTVSPIPAPFTSRPLLFPPIATAADIAIGINETCVSILDGPCTYMWTYGGTYPGVMIRRPTGETTRVTFKALGADEIAEYLDKIDPLDKAGAYAIQDHGEMIVAKTEGSYSNVVGLPVERLKTELTFFVA